MTVAGNQLSAPILDDGEGAEAVVFQFENPLRMIERQGSAGSGMDWNAMRKAYRRAGAKVKRIATTYG